MNPDQDDFYKKCFRRICDLFKSAPAKAKEEMRKDGRWLFFEALEADDLETAHELLDIGALSDFDERLSPEHWLYRAWYQFPLSDDVQKKEKFAAELRRMESNVHFAGQWDAMLGLAIALKDGGLVWKYAKGGGRIRQWGTPGEKWTFRQILNLTCWEDVRNPYRSRCFFKDRGLEYELMFAEIVYDTMKRLEPVTKDVERDELQLICKHPDVELFFRPIMDDVDHEVRLECSFYGANASPFTGAVSLGLSWERLLAMKIDADFAGMFTPGELVGSVLADYASEFGFALSQICDRKLRRHFAAKLGALDEKHPRPSQSNSKRA